MSSMKLFLSSLMFTFLGLFIHMHLHYEVDIRSENELDVHWSSKHSNRENALINQAKNLLEGEQNVEGIRYQETKYQRAELVQTAWRERMPSILYASLTPFVLGMLFFLGIFLAPESSESILKSAVGILWEPTLRATLMIFGSLTSAPIWNHEWAQWATYNGISIFILPSFIAIASVFMLWITFQKDEKRMLSMTYSALGALVAYFSWNFVIGLFI